MAAEGCEPSLGSYTLEGTLAVGVPLSEVDCSKTEAVPNFIRDTAHLAGAWDRMCMWAVVPWVLATENRRRQVEGYWWGTWRGESREGGSLVGVSLSLKLLFLRV